MPSNPWIVRRWLACAVAVGLLGMAGPAVADRGSQEVGGCHCVAMLAPYNGTSGTSDHRVSLQVPGAAPAEAHFKLTRAEQRQALRHLEVTVVDQVSAGPVQFELRQGGRRLGTFCYRTPRIRLSRPATTFDVYVLTGLCAGGPSVPVSGGVQLVLTR